MSYKRLKQLKSEEERVQYVMDRYEASKTARSGMEEKWNAWWKQYDGQNHAEGDFFVRETYKFVEFLVARFGKVITNREKPFFSVIARQADDQEKAERVERFLGYQMQKACEGEKNEDLLRQLFIYGTMIIDVFWRYEPDEEDVNQDMNTSDEEMPMDEIEAMMLMEGLMNGGAVNGV